MTVLADFLLARIAEDAEDALRLQGAYERDELSVPADLVSKRALAIPAHVIAECEAKRDVITYLRNAWDQGITRGVYKRLALPYADHPDYRQEWRL